MAQTPDGTRPGIILTVSGPGLFSTEHHPAGPIRLVRLRDYRELVEREEQKKPVRPVPQGTESAPPPVPPGMPRPVTKSDPPLQYGQPAPYLPARGPIAPSDPETWPKFPGEGLAYIGDPGDEDIHTGGPR